MRLGPNQYFGERALLGGKDCERAANCIALSPVYFIFIFRYIASN